MPRGTDKHETLDHDRRDLLRKFGAGATVALMAGLSGCGGDGGSTPTSTPTDTPAGDGDTPTSKPTDTPEQMAEPVDPVFNVPTPRVPKNLHWNNYNPTSRAGSTRNWVQEYLIGYRQADQTFVPAPIFESMSVDGTTMTFTLRDDVTWHSGKSITAEDVVTKVKMDVFMNQPPEAVVDSVSAAGGRTAEIKLTTQNRGIALGVFAGRYFNTPTSIYGKFVNQFEDASSDSARDEVRSKVVNFEAKENGCGPFTITGATATQFTGEVHEGHPASDALQGLSLEVTKTTGNQGILQLGIANQIDYIGPIVLSQEALSQLPDHYQINPTSNLNGHGLFWNHENKHIKRRKFRQAIAYIADRKQIAKNAAGLRFKAPVGVPTGIPGVNKGIPQSWLGDTMQQFTAYKTNTDKAAQLLRDAGYSKSGGTWKGPDGNTVKLNLVYPGGWTDWVNAGQTLNSQLQSFGIQTKFQTVDAPTWNGQTFPQGNFDITPRFWGGGRPHPYFGFRTVSNSTNQKNANLPQKVQVPMPVGNPQGSMQEINLKKKTQKIINSSGQEAKQLVRELAWAVNQTLTVLPVMEKLGAVWYSTRGMNVPPADNKWMSVNPPTHLAWPLHEGKITPKRK